MTKKDTHKEPQYIFLGGDAGASGYRLRGKQGAINVPAHIAPNGSKRMVKLEGFGRRKAPMLVEVGGLSFYVGDEAADFGRPIENLNLDRQAGTPEMRAVFYAALTAYQQKHGNFKAPLKIGVGLPNQFLSGPNAAKNKSAVTAWMGGAHEWRADGLTYSVTIEDPRPTGQIVGAMFDYLLDDDGNFVDSRKENFANPTKGILACSIGYDTVELIGVQGRKPLPRYTAGKKLGARTLLDRVRGPDGEYARVEPLLRSGALDVKAQLPTWASDVTGFIEDTWGVTWKQFPVVILVGGGAILLRDTLQLYFEGRAHIPDEPTLATADGLYKLILNQNQEQK